MQHKEVEEYILSMPNARLDYPFGEGVAVYKAFIPDKSSASHIDVAQGASEERSEPYPNTVKRVPEEGNAAIRDKHQQVSSSAAEQAGAVRGDWKMFALIQEGKTPVHLSLKCDPQLAKLLREKYETVMEGYHLNKKHWNTLLLTGQLPMEEVFALILHSYILVTEGEDANRPQA